MNDKNEEGLLNSSLSISRFEWLFLTIVRVKGPESQIKVQLFQSLGKKVAKFSLSNQSMPQLNQKSVNSDIKAKFQWTKLTCKEYLIRRHCNSQEKSEQ